VHRTRLIGFGFLLASAGLWGSSFMPLLALVIGFLLIAGIGVSTYHPAAYAAIHDAGHGQGRTYGAFESAGSIAIMLMLVMTGLLTGLIGWRGVLAVGAIPGALMGLVLLVWPGATLGEAAPATAAQGRRAGQDRRAKVPAAIEPAGPAELALERSVSGKGRLLPAMFLLAVMLRVLGLTALNSFIPTYLVRAIGMDPGLAAFSLGFTFLGAMVGSYFMGRVADRAGAVRVFLATTGILVPMLPVLGLTLPMFAYPLLLVLVGFANSACLPAQNMILTALSGARGKGSVFGGLMGATTLTASASPLLFGLIADSAGLTAAVFACGVPVAAAFVVTLIVWRMIAGSRR
jgi:MFS family permease